MGDSFCFLRIHYSMDLLFCKGENGKFGFIDKMGDLIIPYKYDKAASFSNGRVLVVLNGEKFWIDKEGNRVE